MANYIVIPAVLDSDRLPRKLLLEETGKPLIQHTWENCLKVPNVKSVIIATDSAEIQYICEKFGAEVHHDFKSTSCGTERVVKTAMKLDDCDAVVNVQGEWPCIDPDDIFRTLDAVSLMPDEPLMASLYWREPPKESPTLAKVIVNKLGHALYFSRENIPYRSDELLYNIGIYSLSRTLIRLYSGLMENKWESVMVSEDLEQLRVLDEGFQITMLETKNKTMGVDTPELYKEFVESQFPELPC